MSWRRIPLSQIICFLSSVLSGIQSGHLGILTLVLKTQAMAIYVLWASTDRRGLG